MKTSIRSYRLASAVSLAAMILPGLLLGGCGSGGGSTAGGSASGASLPPIDASRGGVAGGPGYAPTAPTAQPRQGMSTGKKVALLAGAAAVYYLYKKNQAKRAESAQAAASTPQYYLSKNGRVYYRQANKQVVYVTPPAQPISVPYEEAQQYRDFQGYDNRRDGRDLVGLGSN